MANSISRLYVTAVHGKSDSALEEGHKDLLSLRDEVSNVLSLLMYELLTYLLFGVSLKHTFSKNIDINLSWHSIF